MISPEIGQSITIRRYLPQDLEAIVRLDRLCFAPSFRFSRSEMRGFAEGPGAITLIAETSDRLAGFIIVEVHQPHVGSAYLATLDVANSFGRQGVGSRLLRAGEAGAREAGDGRMLLHVHTANLRAVAFYERTGYTRVTTLRNFYRNVPGRGDAYLYEKATNP